MKHQTFSGQGQHQISVLSGGEEDIELLHFDSTMLLVRTANKSIVAQITPSMTFGSLQPELQALIRSATIVVLRPIRETIFS